MEHRSYIHTDIVIVGSGVAGLFAALCLPESKKILMITKEDLKECDSYLAQGGVCVLKSLDDFKCFYEDTMKAGHYENNPESVRVMIESSPDVIGTLIKLGADFDTKKDGDFDYTREGAHRNNRILHHKDETGKEITTTLLSIAKNRRNITFIPQTTMIDLIEHDNTCYGIVCEDEFGERGCILAQDIILATGGIGGLFKSSTNYPHITGDSFALAIKHGITLQDMSYIQIHPTTLYSKKSGRRFLISESVRGEGAILLNENGERFTDELQPRDVVTEAIVKEEKKFGTDHVYLTLPNMTSEEAHKRFPNIFEACMDEGYDMTKDKVPVTPAQHYMMGGIQTDINGCTSMRHLYAAGETACNGVHGKNRLASNSLLESMVFAKRAADLIAKDKEEKERIDNMRQEFIVNVSHELKTPIALIQGYAEGLTAGVADDPEDRKFYCDTIADEADHMNKLVMQLLSLSRLELGAEQTFDEDIDLHALCAEAVRKTAVLCENRGLTVEYENTHITVRTDGDLLDQVLMNYLSNAIRYTPEGKHIEISAARTGNSVRLSVFNEGEGLPEEELPKIWEKFYRTDRARTREAGGTGIGLSLVRAIADTLHGACGAENVEGGICFWFELPDLLPAEDSEIKD